MTPNAIALALGLLLPVTHLVGAETTITGEAQQGGLLFGKTAPGNQVVYAGRELMLSPDGAFVLGFGRDRTGTARVSIKLTSGQQELFEFEIAPRKYQIERIEGLPPSKVTPKPEVQKRIRRETRMIKHARSIREKRQDFEAGFSWPACGRLSGFYGSQRILNGKPRRPHFGLDIAAPEDSIVRAPTAGKITLAEADLFYSGGTIILDHGHGLSSSFLHLNSIAVKMRQTVEAGQEIGRIGSTGRATGAHLDWRINWQGERIDPLLLFGLSADDKHTTCE